MIVNLASKYRLGLSQIYLNAAFLHASAVVVTHFMFHKNSPTCSRYPSYQQISHSFQEMPMRGFGLHFTTDSQVLMS